MQFACHWLFCVLIAFFCIKSFPTVTIYYLYLKSPYRFSESNRAAVKASDFGLT